MAFGIVVLANYYTKLDEWTVYKPNPDWRTVARALAAQAGTREPLVVISMSPALELAYYGSFELAFYTSGSIVNDADTIARQPGGAATGGGSLRDRLSRALEWQSHPLTSAAGRVYVLSGADLALVREVFTRERVESLYFTHNAYWLGMDPPNHVLHASQRLMQALETDPSFATGLAVEVKGIRVLRTQRVGHARVGVDPAQELVDPEEKTLSSW